MSRFNRPPVPNFWGTVVEETPPPSAARTATVASTVPVFTPSVTSRNSILTTNISTVNDTEGPVDTQSIMNWLDQSFAPSVVSQNIFDDEDDFSDALETVLRAPHQNPRTTQSMLRRRSKKRDYLQGLYNRQRENLQRDNRDMDLADDIFADRGAFQYMPSTSSGNNGPLRNLPAPSAPIGPPRIVNPRIRTPRVDNRTAYQRAVDEDELYDPSNLPRRSGGPPARPPAAPTARGGGMPYVPAADTASSGVNVNPPRVDNRDVIHQTNNFRVSYAAPRQDTFDDVHPRNAAEDRTRQQYVNRNIQVQTDAGPVEDLPNGSVGSVSLVMENRRVALNSQEMMEGIYNAADTVMQHQGVGNSRGYMSVDIQGSNQQNLRLNTNFQQFDFTTPEGKAAFREAFIAMLLDLLQSPPGRLALDAIQTFAGTITNLEDAQDAVNGLYRDPLFITIDWVVPPVNEQGEEQDVPDFNDDNGLDPQEQEEEEEDQEPIAHRTRQRLRRQQQLLGGAIPANGPRQRRPRRAQFRGNYRFVGGLPKEYQAIDHRGRFLVIENERDVCIYPPPPPRYQLSKHALKRQKVKNRKPLEEIHEIFSTRYNRGINVGAYELNNQEELHFYKKSIQHVYQRKGILHLTPQTTSKSCFLMSIIRSECFAYHMNESKQYLKKTRVGGDGTESSEDEREFILECTLPEWNAMEQNYSFAYYDEEKNNYCIRLMNRFISYDSNTQEFQAELSVQEIYYWELAARELEIYLLTKNTQMDVNCLESVGQTVSNVFHLVISIYDVEMYGERVWCFQPNKESIFQSIHHQQDQLLIVSLLYDHGHMFGICDLIKYLSVELKNKLDFNAYCPFCQVQGTRILRKKSTSLAHIQDCWCKNRYKKPVLEIYTVKEHTKQEMEMGVIPIEWRYEASVETKCHCCIYCHQPVKQEDYIQHQCLITCNKKKEILEKKQLYVYDLEAAQIAIPNVPDTYYHVCNMVCFRKMYPETEEEKRGFTFQNEYEFMDFVVKECHDIVILAHNGGSYDHQFVVRYLERLKITHSFIPSPNSLHKFLSVTVHEKNIQFLDFIYFLPGSLKSISESMNIETLKGDFPHRFNTKEDISYEGRIPPIDTEEDYWCLLTKRDQKSVDEMKIFFQEQCVLYCTCEISQPRNGVCTQCLKQTWKMREVMQRYCMQDVIVLGNCCAKYREQLLEMREERNEEEKEVWNPVNIDPFQYLTVPQLALNILISGYEQSPFTCLKSKTRLGQCPQAIQWLEMLMEKQNIHIYHRMNWTHEYYHYEMEQFADGYCEALNSCYVCLDCDVWGCENCHFYKNHFQPELKHPIFPTKSYMEVYELTEEMIAQWLQHGAHVIRKCEIQLELSEYEKKCYSMQSLSSYFYGGRTEVFQLYYNESKSQNQKIQYHDVCSLYPYVCAFKELPNGEPEYILGKNIERERVFHSDEKKKYWGFISCRVRPNPHCLLGLLPSRLEEGRLQFSLQEQDGCWGLNELEFAWRQGYELLEVYGIIHWSPEKRSDKLFRPYVDFFLRMKQEAEGWKKLGSAVDEPLENQKEQLVESLYESNGNIARVRPERVSKNPVKRMLAKLFLNSLWGKFAQKPQNKVNTVIYGLKEFFRIWGDKRINLSSIRFRQTNSEIFKVQYELNLPYVRSNGRGNMALAAKVTEHARCELHKQMFRIGPERIIYCDTDSIIFHWDEDGEDLTGVGLGKWVNEYPKDRIAEFYALAPKFYFLLLGSEKSCLKIKGVQATMVNVLRLQRNEFRELLEDGVVDKAGGGKKEVWMDYMSIYANCQRNLGVNYGVMMTRYGKKSAKLMITKRTITKMKEIDWSTLIQIRTTPLH